MYEAQPLRFGPVFVDRRGVANTCPGNDVSGTPRRRGQPRLPASQLGRGSEGAAEQFLIAVAYRFVPSAVVRDELYGRAQRVAKSGSRPATMF